jgi:hypothetical protein
MASIISQPLSTSATAGTTISFTVAVDRIGDPTPSVGAIQYDYRITYDWQYRIDSSSSWISANRKITKNTFIPSTWTGSTRNSVYSDTLTINASLGRNNRQYRCIITYQRRNYGINVNIFEQTLISLPATITILDRLNIFNLQSFDLIPNEDIIYKNALIEAANIWNNFIKYPKFLLDYLTSSQTNFNGLSLSQYRKKNENASWIAGVIRIENINFSSTARPVLKFYRYFELDVNSKYFINTFGSPYTYNDWVKILTHELGHALGIGAWNNFLEINELAPFTGSLPRLTRFTHPSTVNSYNRIALNVPLTRESVPVENVGPIGSSGVHWQNNYVPARSAISGSIEYIRPDYNGIYNELMVKTYRSDNIITPLSIGYLQDLGYEEVSPGARQPGIITTDNGRTPLINPQSISENFCKTCNNVYLS